MNEKMMKISVLNDFRMPSSHTGNPKTLAALLMMITRGKRTEKKKDRDAKGKQSLLCVPWLLLKNSGAAILARVAYDLTTSARCREGSERSSIMKGIIIV